MKQTELSKRAKISNPYLSQIIMRHRRPSWDVAKRLAEAAGTSPILWLEGTTEQIRKVLAGKIEDPFANRVNLATDAADIGGHQAA